MTTTTRASSATKPPADKAPVDKTTTIARVIKWAAIPLGLLASGVLVWVSSNAAFNATTQNPDNNWNAGTVQLSDDAAGVAAFSAENLKPGATDSRCIVVTSDGSLPAAVKLYASNPSTTKALASHLDLTVEHGTGGSFGGGCSGFTPAGTTYSGTLAGFTANHSGYASGAGSWSTSGGASQSRTYKITYALQESTPNSAQGGTAAVDFTWEAQNS